MSDEQDSTVHSLALWLTDLKVQNSRVLQELLSETSIIRDSITKNQMELTDFKRHSTGISGQMQGQLSDLREKLSGAFGEITALVKQKSLTDQETMQDVTRLQQHMTTKNMELESLKKSYSQAHTQLQSSLVQIENHIHVTQSEVVVARGACERVQRDTMQRFGDIQETLRSLEDELNLGNAENHNQMQQLRDETDRITETLNAVSNEFMEYKRTSNIMNNKLQSQVWGLEELRRKQQSDLAAQLKPSACRSEAAFSDVGSCKAPSQRPLPTMSSVSSLQLGVGPSSARGPMGSGMLQTVAINSGSLSPRRAQQMTLSPTASMPPAAFAPTAPTPSGTFSMPVMQCRPVR